MSKMILGVPKNNRSGLIFALFTLLVINTFIILSGDVLLLIGIIIFDIYGLAYYYFNYLRICRFANDKLIIYGNFTFDEETKVQKSYEIKYDSVKSVERHKIPKGMNSDRLPYKKSKLTYDDRYNLEQLDCLLIKLQDESEKLLFISHLSDDKIELIESEIIKKITK